MNKFILIISIFTIICQYSDIAAQSCSNIEANKYLEEGNKFNLINKHLEAINSFKKAIELDPSCADAYNMRGNSYEKLNRNEEAVIDYTKSIELNPNYADAYKNRGRYYHKNDENNNAILDFNKAIQLNPEVSVYYYDRGTIYISMTIKNEDEVSNINKAISDFDKAIQLSSSQDEYYFNRGIAYSLKYNNSGNLFDCEQALNDYKEALKLNPELKDELSEKIEYYNSILAENKSLSFTQDIKIKHKGNLEMSVYDSNGIVQRIDWMYCTLVSTTEAFSGEGKTIIRVPVINQPTAYFNCQLVGIQRWLNDYRASEDGDSLTLSGYYWMINGKKIMPKISQRGKDVNYYIELERE